MGCSMIVVFAIAILASAGWLLLSNLSDICFLLMMISYIILGIYILGSGVKEAFSKKNPLLFVTGLILGFFTAFGLVFTWSSLELNPSSEYYILGKIGFNIEFLSIVIATIIIGILFSFFILAKQSDNIVFQSVICLSEIIIIIIYCLFFTIVGTKSYSDNTLKEYDFSSMQTEYTIKKDAKIYYVDSSGASWPVQLDFLQFPFGRFDEGEEVYELSPYKNNGCIEVSNGKKCGYVKEDDLEPLYTYSWQAKTDQVPIYEAIPYEEETNNAGTITWYSKSNQIIGYLSIGENFELRGGTSDGILVETSSGMIGFVDRNSVEEIKTPIDKNVSE